MKSGSLSPLATVATQTDPWSDDCRLSLFGDHYDDLGDDELSDHLYQLHAPQYTAQPGSVPLYDYIQRTAGDSESDDDGYDVIDDDCSNDNTDVYDRSYRTNQLRPANFINGITMVTSIPDFKRQPWASAYKVPMYPFRDVTQRSTGEIELVKEMAPVKGNHSVIKLGTESCRNRRAIPVELVDEIFSSHGVSSRQTCRSRLVPTMGTRLRATRLHTISSVGSSEDRLCTTPPDISVLDVCMMPSSTSTSDNERTSSPVTAASSSPVAPSRQARTWNSDGETPVISFDQAPSVYRSRVRSPAEVRTFQTSDSRGKSVSITSHPIETVECCSPTSSLPSSDDLNKMSPTETRQSGIEDFDSEVTPSTRRRFIYEHYADVMYTNQANLAHTIMVQQRLFQQLLADSKPTEIDCKLSSVEELPLRTDDVVQSRRRYRSRPVEDELARDVGKDIRDSSYSKWIVRRRKDGTRYVTRSRHENGEVKAESRWRHHQIFAGDHEHNKVDRAETDKQVHVNKHRRVSTSGKDHGSPIAMSREERVNCADLASKTTMMKSGQHHPILAVVTI